MIQSLLEPVSTFASDIDLLIDVIGLIVWPWFFLVQAMFFWLLWRYRYREGVKALYVTGNEPELKRWITIPHGIIILMDLIVIAGAVKVWYNVKQELPEAHQTVRVVAQQWAWSFWHPGKDGVLGTDDDIETVDELHIEVDKLYHVQLESLDVLHSFSVPVFRLKQDMIPGRVITAWFEAQKTGSYDIQCTEICGVGHGIMGARIHIESAEEHAAWVARASNNP